MEFVRVKGRQAALGGEVQGMGGFGGEEFGAGVGGDVDGCGFGGEEEGEEVGWLGLRGGRGDYILYREFCCFGCSGGHRSP